MSLCALSSACLWPGRGSPSIRRFCCKFRTVSSRSPCAPLVVVVVLGASSCALGSGGAGPG
eukprot:12472104-Prorocentrum_lima.AAC.1